MSAVFRTYQVLFVLLWVLFLPSTTAEAQSTISGTVLDSDTGKPLPGTNVFLEGTMRGTVTDGRGRFTLSKVEPGTYVLIASMIGYARVEKKVIVRARAPNSEFSDLQLELEPDPIQLNGVTVEGDRSTWLKRLKRFRESFFGTAPNAGACSFVNPEVLAFKMEGDTLVALARRPLRVRNEALGYEVTYHLPRYEARPDAWVRYGTAEFDTLAADGLEQRTDWQQARKETYRGSLYHFLDALQADRLNEAGFQVRVASVRHVQVEEGRVQVSRGAVISDVRKIFVPTDLLGRAYLSIPRARAADSGLLVQYDPDRQFSLARSQPSGGRFPESDDSKMTWIRILGGHRVLIDTQTGMYVRIDENRYIMRGYWARYMTAATALPAEYEVPGSF